MSKKNMVCIVCPMGCRLTVTTNENAPLGYVVEGNKCKRGEDYGIKELTNPTRVITSTVKITNAHLRRLPVRTDGAVPKNKIDECMKVINSINVKSPIKVGEIIIPNILGTGIDLIATRDM
ncbi:DUF1667 domain-containing protein [Clostridium sp. MSJ-11]|uniref:DUF1667 domain-containing protein n=1 Tax=Clostridium mobile TaxID=2841512 RepID=A0ABS6EHB7_9CLOT|nr:DUF1667 domain-containing protein [Clostridium mobile]MBU5484613.1 DUF1667 domain-containing protein [Clostridium mobile]